MDKVNVFKKKEFWYQQIKRATGTAKVSILDCRFSRKKRKEVL